MDLSDANGAADTTPPAPGPTAETAAPSPGVTPESPPAADVDARGSSDHDKGVEKRTLLQVVQEAVKPPAPAEPPKPADSPTAEAKPDPSAPKPPSDTELPDLAESRVSLKDYENEPFGKHPRFRQLLRGYNARGQELEALRAPAEQYNLIQKFMDDNRLDTDLAAQGFTLMAQLAEARRGSVDHAKLFLEQIDQVRDELLTLTGGKVAPELRARVENGEIAETDAQALATAEANARAAQARAADLERQRQQEAAAARQTSIRNAVSSWESQQRTRDPDFAKKEQLMQRVARALVAEHGTPADADAAVTLAKKAYEEASRYLESAAPPPPPTQRSPSSQSVPASRSAPVPTSLAEVVRLAAGAR